MCASVFLLACAEQLHAKMCCHPCRCGGSNGVDEKTAKVRRGSDANVLVALKSPADIVNAIVVVIIVTFWKSTNETLICLRQAGASFTVSLQREEQKKGKE